MRERKMFFKSPSIGEHFPEEHLNWPLLGGTLTSFIGVGVIKRGKIISVSAGKRLPSCLGGRVISEKSRRANRD